jgi:hypothetical protein
MRNLVNGLLFTLAAVLVFSDVALSQEVTDIAPGPGWLPAVRRHSIEAQRADRIKYKIYERKLASHDLSGMWGETGFGLNAKGAPPFTPYGQRLSDTTQADISPAGFAIESSKDPQQICDPMGFPRLWTFNYGFEFVQLPDRLLQFFEWSHTWRTIWTDGRQLPPNPPQQRFLGYSVGRWEGDTFIVESNGYDDRSWIGRDSRNGARGFPHSEEMRTVERYRRTAIDTLESELTIYDPKVYTAPWTSSGKAKLYPGTEIGEYFCVPSEERDFQNFVSRPAAGAEPLK